LTILLLLAVRVCNAVGVIITRFANTWKQTAELHVGAAIWWNIY
jgi:hypothetical protein